MKQNEPNLPQTRRTFLKNTGIAAAYLPFVSSSAISVNTAPQKIRIGVVGGGFGCSFIVSKSSMLLQPQSEPRRYRVL